jgi:3-hydroxyisobutyrate dehydrogenase
LTNEKKGLTKRGLDMNIGFIGLGKLGYAIAKHLIDEGQQLVVWNRTTSRTTGLKAGIAASPAELLGQTAVVILNLFDSDAVHSVMSVEGGLLSGDCRGKIIIDTTTNHFGAVEAFYEMFQDKGARYLEAPVLGSVGPASQGKLTVLVSGEKSAFEKVEPLINKIGAHVFFFGAPTLATKMKLVNNMVLGTFMATLAEAVVMAEAVGLEKKEVLDILTVGAGNSSVLNAKREKLLTEDFDTHFSSALIYKDLHFLQDLARELNRPSYTGSAVKEMFALTLQKGIADQDFSAIYKALKDS